MSNKRSTIGEKIDLAYLGFASREEFNKLVASADMSTPEARDKFFAWQINDGTKDGLLYLLSSKNLADRSCMKYKVVRAYNDGKDFYSYALGTYEGGTKYVIGEVAPVHEVFSKLGYYPTVFSDLKCAVRFLKHMTSVLQPSREKILYCNVSKSVIPIPPRLVLYNELRPYEPLFETLKAPKEDLQGWPEGTEMWKEVIPMDVVSDYEVRKTLEMLK